MADITKCTGKGCTKKESCYRFTALDCRYRQSYFSLTPLKEDGTCEYYWDNKN